MADTESEASAVAPSVFSETRTLGSSDEHSRTTLQGSVAARPAMQKFSAAVSRLRVTAKFARAFQGGDGEELNVATDDESSQAHSHEGSEHHFGESDSDVEDEEMAVAPFATFLLRDKIHHVFEGIPYSFRAIDELKNWIFLSAVIVNITVFVIVLSCATFAVDSLPYFWETHNRVLFGLESFCVAWFTLEYLIRFFTCREKLWFIIRVLNILDLISILPYYIGLIVELSTGNANPVVSRSLLMLRVLRLSRVLRVLKLSKHSYGMNSVWETFRRSQAALTLMLFLLGLCLLLGAALIYFSEQLEQSWDSRRRLWIRSNGEVSPFQSIFHALWFAMVTITTTGYGDDVVISSTGKLSAVILMIIGVFVIAFPTVILSSNFHDIHNKRLEDDSALLQKQKESEEERSRIQRETEAAKAGGDADPTHSPDPFSADDGPPPIFLMMRGRRAVHRQMSFSYVAREMGDPMLEYHVPGEPSRNIFIFGTKALWAPLLTFVRERCGPRGLNGERPFRSVLHPNHPTGVLVTLQLQLHTVLAQKAAQNAVNQLPDDVSQMLSVSYRPIRTLRVSWKSPHPALYSAKVVTDEYHYPVGTVPLQVWLPVFESLPAFLRYSAGVGFVFEVEFEERSAHACAGGIPGTQLPVTVRGADKALKKSLLASGFGRSQGAGPADGATPPQNSLKQSVNRSPQTGTTPVLNAVKGAM